MFSSSIQKFLKGNALFSTSASDMTAARPVGGTTKQVQNEPGKNLSADEQITDMKILSTLAKYLWLKDNPEFRYRVLLAFALLVGAKVRFIFHLKGFVYLLVSISLTVKLDCLNI